MVANTPKQLLKSSAFQCQLEYKTVLIL